VPSIVDKMRKNMLRWFGHVTKRRNLEAIVLSLKINIDGMSRRGGLKKMWISYISYIGVPRIAFLNLIEMDNSPMALFINVR